jgi:hypothetical protein
MRRKFLFMIIAVLALLLAPMATMAATAPSSVDASPMALCAGTTATVRAPAGLRLRTGPGLGRAIILVMGFGETVHITGSPVWRDGISWTPVQFHRWGRTYFGYCASVHLGPPVHVPPPVSGLRVTAWAGLRLRWGPGLGFGIYAAVPRGTILQPTGTYQWAGGIRWAQVQYQGQFLWAASMYLTPA